MYATYYYKNTDMKYKLMDEGQLKETSQAMASYTYKYMIQ